MKKDKFKIAVLGYGTVGRALVTLLDGHDSGIEVVSILRRPGKATEARMTDTFETVLAQKDLDAVVDVLPGAEPSFGYIQAALEAGLNVVTANKAALAKDFAGLLALAHSKGVRLLFEASCGGGMPIVETLKKLTRFDRVNALEGILNGTCNFMLDAMESRGWSFEEALREAQRLGYAEADPSADISGRDVLNKAVIACSLAYGAPVSPDMPVSGIEKVSADFVRSLLGQGKHLRLMLLSRARDGRYAAGIVPVVVSADTLAANVKENFNFARIDCDVLGPLSLMAQGAGGNPTADAVIHDLLNCQLGTAEEGRLDGSLSCDPSLLTGRAYIGADVHDAVTLEEAVALARKLDAFLAFEPL